MNKLSVLLLVFGLSVLSAASSSYKIDFTQPQSDTYELQYELKLYQLEEIDLDGTTYTQIQFDNGVYVEQKGYARLPKVSAPVMLPAQKNMTLSIENVEYEDISLSIPLLPSRGIIYRNQNPSEIPYEIDPASVTDSWFPEALSYQREPYIIKDIRGASIFFHPFRYNAEKQVLRVYKKITVRLVENDEPPTNPLVKPTEHILPEMNGLYGSVFMNYDASEQALAYGEYGDILVITTDRDTAAVRDYIIWKREKGFNVFREIVPAGTNPKDLIQEKYDENNDMLYVQLIGDWADIKCDLGTSSNLPMDPQLGCVVGDDYYADIAVGRLSANSAAQVTVQVNKIITYEKNPVSGADWYRTATGIASNQGPGDDNEYDNEHLDVVYNDKLDPFTYDLYNDIYDPGASDDMVTDAVNNGTSIINYTGHGSATSWGTSGFNNDDVNNLSNGDMLPFIVSVACNNGEFNRSSDCFAEAWLKKEGGGAVIMLASSISQPWDPPMRGQDYFMDLLIGGYDYDAHSGQNGINTSEQRTLIGPIVINGFAMMLNESDYNSDVETVQTWGNFGDPSLQVRTVAPAAVSLSDEQILSGQPFSTTVTSAGQPVENAMVAISQNNKYYSALSDANGNVTIEHDFNVGTARLVVTAFNTETIYKDVEVVSGDGPHIVMESFSIDDTTSGNGNGAAEFDESFNLNVTAKNTGNEPAAEVNATLTSDDIYATITDNTYFYGDMDSGAVKFGDDAFAMQAANNTPDQHVIQAGVLFTDNAANEWTSGLTITVNAPDLNIGNLTVDDAAGGDGNGRLDPGEQADILIETGNSGHAAAPNTGGQLSTSNSYVTINNDTHDFGTLAAGANDQGLFNVTIDGSTPAGEMAEFIYTVTSGAYTVKDTFNLLIGEAVVYLMSNSTVNVKNGLFYDSGGQENNYAAKEDLTMTFFPEGRSPAVKVVFNAFNTHESYDKLYVHDGSSTSAPQVPGSPFSGTTLPDEIVANNTEGALTFHFKSNPILGNEGWQADIFSTTISEIEARDALTVSEFRLENNFPNPFNPSTTIRYQIAEAGPVKLVIYDMLGKEIRTLINNHRDSGSYEARWDGRDNNGRMMATGIYFYKISSGSFSKIKKMILVK